MKNIVKNMKFEKNRIFLEILKEKDIRKETYILDEKLFKNKTIQYILDKNMIKDSFFPCYADGEKIILILFESLKKDILDILYIKFKLKVISLFCDKNNFLIGIEKFKKIYKYGNTEDIENIFKELQKKENKNEKRESEDIYKSLSIESPIVVKGLSAIIIQGVERGASDIHIEPGKDHIRIRYRIDGILTETEKISLELLSPMISRLKIISNLDIIERRMPQDGRFDLEIRERKIDFRVSVMPVINGEKAVIRILDKEIIEFEIDKIGMEKSDYDRLLFQLNRKNGIFLISGPTGSGKSSTLYALLKKLNTGEVNISTVEDPVEYEIDGINQVQCKNNIGRTFASVLRAYLRQDPDILMVGEIRDQETAEIAVKAAITGHLVLSTIHTNDSIGGINRLLNIGIQPYMVSASLIAILSQRLVRKLCPHCQEKDEKWKAKIQLLGHDYEKYHENMFYIGKGCESCNYSGYKGRTAIFEIFEPNEKIKEMIEKGNSAQEIEKEALNDGMKKLVEDGIEKVKMRITSLDEILRQC
ncbi:type II/IV secretion system protein [Fusobacterium ulcerans]|uniref:GspE/PulE family protein n=1 Tax=Fusobacterium ulcerans TaxID=861 RepID=UPI000E5383F7|nr:GspE/PulE family protein [Fusobacterium ulcerans]RGY60045.1 type II/IV secretion system protein [Fusobacterium ulcerans]